VHGLVATWIYYMLVLYCDHYILINVYVSRASKWVEKLAMRELWTKINNSETPNAQHLTSSFSQDKRAMF